MVATPLRLAALAAGSLAGLSVARRLVAEATAWSLEGRVAVVTGSTRGLGLVLARDLLDAGCRVAICGRDEPTLRAAVERLGASPNLVAETCDVGDRLAVRDFLERVRRELGPVDLLVTNASTISIGGLDTMDASDFESALRDTFFGTLYPVLEVVPEMRSRGDGRIAVIGSIGGRVAFPHLLPYTAAKYAQVGLSEGLRAELAGDGIVVTTIIPGFMRTGSFLAAEAHDPPVEEYAWFASGGSAPLITISPEWAARRILRAIRHGEADVTLGWFARLGGTVKSLMPGLSADVFGMVNRLVLPERRSNGTAFPARGFEVHLDAPEAVQSFTDDVVESGVDQLNQPSPRR